MKYFFNQSSLIAKHSILYRCVSEIYYTCQSVLMSNKLNINPHKILKNQTNILVYHLLSNGCCFIHKESKTVVEYTHMQEKEHQYIFHYDGKETIYSHKNIQRICLDYGLFNPLDSCKKNVEILLSIDEYMAAIVRNGGRPSGIFSVSQFTSDDQKNKIRDSIQTVLKNIGNKGLAAVVEGDYQWQNLGISPKELQILDIQNAQCKMLCKCFHIPPILMGFEDQTYTSNYTAARDHFIENFIYAFLHHMNLELSKI